MICLGEEYIHNAEYILPHFYPLVQYLYIAWLVETRNEDNYLVETRYNPYPQWHI